MNPLASVANLVARYDKRRLAELSSDGGVRVDPTSIDNNLATTHPIQQCILDATAMILSAVRVSGRYTVIDIYGNNQVSPAIPGSTAVIRLCCDLAFGLLNARRGYAATELDSMAPLFSAANQQLELLRQGERILDTYKIENGVAVLDVAVADAGLPKGYKLLPTDSSSLLTANHRFFGVRSEGGSFPRRDSW